MGLSSTQIGAIGENLLINALMKASEGRLSPFQPLADDDGLDVLFFDKVTGNSVAIQLDTRKNSRFEGCPVIHSPYWTESFDAPTQPVFAGGAP